MCYTCTDFEALILKLAFSASRLRFFTPTIFTVNVLVGRSVIGILRERHALAPLDLPAWRAIFREVAAVITQCRYSKTISCKRRGCVLLHQYTRVLTNSNYLATEFSRHGIQAQCVPLFVSKLPLQPPAIGEFALPGNRDPWRLLFLGRAASLKGGDLLLEALPLVAQKIDRSLSLTIAGDGPALPEWKRIADRVRNDRIEVEFVGWSSRTEDLFSTSHLFVMPSVWPEPFGLSGIEAGSYAVPAVAFATGGIPEWLHEAKNGYLAPTNPPTPKNLAAAITSALSDRNHYLHLRCEGTDVLAN